MATTSISTPNAPEAIGAYSQAIRAGGFLFTAGQIALDPASGKMVDGGIVEQTERVMANLEAVLATVGAGWKDVVKTTVFLVDLSEFPTFNDVYARHLGGARPARSTVQVAALPRGAVVEIEAVARIPE
ncbi:MAG TPA: RidA family protein [Gemmatimonadaceae bacterium]|nr:RidA family protein [Gemmatimonadaceae bacterium]